MSDLAQLGDLFAVGDLSTRWDHSDYQADSIFIIGGTIGFLVARIILIKLCFEPFGRTVMGIKRDAKDQWVYTETAQKYLKSEKTQKDVEIDITKFNKYMWHGLVYGIFWIWGLQLFINHVLREQDIAHLPYGFVRALWNPYPRSSTEKYLFAPYLLTQAAWYCHGFIETIMHERSRNDFALMVAHHLISVVLLVGCIWSGAFCVGMAVVVEQDISDVAIYLAKFVHLAYNIPFLQRKFVHNIVLVGITVTWWSTRCFTLGVIVFSGWHDGIVCGLTNLNSELFDLPSAMLISLLSVLLLMQIVWGIGIAMMMFNQVFTGTFHDMWHDKKKKTQ